MSFATESRLRPLTSASTSRRRETSSRWIESGVWHDPHVGHLAEAHVAAARAVEQQVADVRHALARAGLALHDHVEDLLALEHAADRDALQQRSLRATHVAGLDLVALRLVEVDLDLDLRLGGGLRHARVDDTVDLRDELTHPLRLAAQDVLLLAEDAHDERLVGAGQHVEAVAAVRVVAVGRAPRRP